MTAKTTAKQKEGDKHALKRWAASAPYTSARVTVHRPRESTNCDSSAQAVRRPAGPVPRFKGHFADTTAANKLTEPGGAPSPRGSGPAEGGRSRARPGLLRVSAASTRHHPPQRPTVTSAPSRALPPPPHAGPGGRPPPTAPRSRRRPPPTPHPGLPRPRPRPWPGPSPPPASHTAARPGNLYLFLLLAEAAHQRGGERRGAAAGGLHARRAGPGRQSPEEPLRRAEGAAGGQDGRAGAGAGADPICSAGRMSPIEMFVESEAPAPEPHPAGGRRRRRRLGPGRRCRGKHLTLAFWAAPPPGHGCRCAGGPRERRQPGAGRRLPPPACCTLGSPPARQAARRARGRLPAASRERRALPSHPPAAAGPGGSPTAAAGAGGEGHGRCPPRRGRADPRGAGGGLPRGTAWASGRRRGSAGGPCGPGAPGGSAGLRFGQWKRHP